jgi:hypothetical protein
MSVHHRRKYDSGFKRNAVCLSDEPERFETKVKHMAAHDFEIEEMTQWHMKSLIFDSC